MSTRFRIGILVLAVTGLWTATANAGMPAPLPSGWTKDHIPEWMGVPTQSGSAGSIDARLQAISFFIVCLLLCAWGVLWLWRGLRKDLTWLPQLTYRRSLSLVVLWGLLFVIVLTMISGARELMTPGAWRKQGWTYKLNEATPDKDIRTERKMALERLRLALWQYAATHHGRFPSGDDPAIDAALWVVPGDPGQRFILVPDREAEDAGRLLVSEPETDGHERLVLLTNGMLGTMRTSEIQQPEASTTVSREPDATRDGRH
jgi:hypothetical protein